MQSPRTPAGPDALAWQDYLALRACEEVLRAHAPFDLARGELAVARHGDALVVVLTGQGRSSHHPGHRGGPGLEIVLDPETLAVRSWHYLR